MTRGVIKTLLRKHLRSQRSYALARRAMLLGQYLTRRPDEPDLLAFKALRERDRGLVIDIGANGGQSAIAFSFLLPRFQIVSFEPNPALWAELDFVARIIGDRFSYRKAGLGSSKGNLELFVPQIDDFPITTRASLDRDAAEQHCLELEREVGKKFSVQEKLVDVVTFDSLELHPDAIKIDVEGFELEVLKGMTRTLETARPMLMLESNLENMACADLLSQFDYRFFYRDKKSGALSDVPDEGASNWFAIRSDQVSEILAKSSTR